MMKVNLLVIRTKDMEKVASFYRTLGISMEYHKHDKSPYHYSGYVGPTLLEIYPLAKDQVNSDRFFRLGIELDNFEDVIDALRAENVVFFQEPQQLAFGYMAIVLDPDGRKIELYRSTIS